MHTRGLRDNRTTHINKIDAGGDCCNERRSTMLTTFNINLACENLFPSGCVKGAAGTRYPHNPWVLPDRLRTKTGSPTVRVPCTSDRGARAHLNRLGEFEHILAHGNKIHRRVLRRPELRPARHT